MKSINLFNIQLLGQGDNYFKTYLIYTNQLSSFIASNNGTTLLLNFIDCQNYQKAKITETQAKQFGLYLQILKN